MFKLLYKLDLRESNDVIKGLSLFCTKFEHEYSQIIITYYTFPLIKHENVKFILPTGDLGLRINSKF